MTRRELDAYFTPPGVTRALLSVIKIPYGMPIIVEPCMGDGSIVNELNKGVMNPLFLTNDIDPGLGAHYHHDATSPDAYIWHPDVGLKETDWVITNPPFSKAVEIASIALDIGVSVAMLLRLSFLEPTKKRFPFWYRHGDELTHVIVMGQPRPSFTYDGRTDSVTTAWFVWQRYGDIPNTRFLWKVGWDNA